MNQTDLLKRLYSAFLDSDVLLIDSRKISQEVALGKKVLFVALKGERFDANEYVQQSLDSGATYIVTSRADLNHSDNIFYADDTLNLLQQLAAYHRSMLSCKVVAITGSNGKTTTKELLVATLQKSFKVAYTKGNFNNHIGVPLTLLSLTSDDEIAVVEHGANHIGEIKALASLSHPDVGLITNIGRAHIGEFGGIEGIIKAKGELYDALEECCGVAVVNSSLDHLNSMISSREEKLSSVIYDMSQFEEVDDCRYLTYRWNNQLITTNLIGSYNLYNIAAATAIASYFGVDNRDIAEAISAYRPQNMRSQLTITDRNSIVVDAYNANPSSMIAAIENFEKRSPSGVYILGDMRELGSYSETEHNTIAERVSKINRAKVILVGANFKASSITYGLTWFEDVNSLINSGLLQEISKSTILLKGSRSNAMECCIEYL